MVITGMMIIMKITIMVKIIIKIIDLYNLFLQRDPSEARVEFGRQIFEHFCQGLPSESSFLKFKKEFKLNSMHHDCHPY